jgi:hypothetical protein
VAVVQVPVEQVDWGGEVAVNTPPATKPHLAPSEFVNDMVNEQDAAIEKEVVAPVFPVTGDGEQPLIV